MKIVDFHVEHHDDIISAQASSDSEYTGCTRSCRTMAGTEALAERVAGDGHCDGGGQSLVAAARLPGGLAGHPGCQPVDLQLLRQAVAGLQYPGTAAPPIRLTQSTWQHCSTRSSVTNIYC